MENQKIKEINVDLFSDETIKKVSEKFSEKAYVTFNSSNKLNLTKKASIEDMEKIRRQFCNELIIQAAATLEKQNQKKEMYTVLQQNLDELEREAFDDPLGISEQWEEKNETN